MRNNASPVLTGPPRETHRRAARLPSSLAIIGAGNVGGALSDAATKAGHRVTVAADTEHASKVAAATALLWRRPMWTPQRRPMSLCSATRPPRSNKNHPETVLCRPTG
ncbi:NAD(P)-binding domain-containing protein [Actinocrispum sp. NPDC049592]|uniref:NAD(P)-binding domain-containing protein n=1 Tax=Actinocrispum sp. NPDC049592 TaxID=3154835 RepID=UPI00342F02DF